MHIPLLIDRKRRGEALGPNEIKELIALFAAGNLPNSQMSALAMAICFQGMNDEECVALTEAMLESGERFSHIPPHPTVVDKHSTGGVGDKTSLVLAPLLACDTVWVPMISGRGLGITGGTLDKLESIPGLSTSLTPDAAIQQLRKIGVFIMGQTDAICPADRKLYALRHFTSTIDAIPLIVSSILSKKLAESLDRLVIDVKYGSGAFMKSQEEAENLATAIRTCGKSFRLGVKTVLSPMNEPLGHAVGNASEVMEAVETLQGGGPPDLRKLALDLAVQIGHQTRADYEQWLDDGTAYAKWVKLIESQGGDASAAEKMHMQIGNKTPSRVVAAEADGVVLEVEASMVGEAACLLGAGRAQPGDEVDPKAGITGLVKCGEQVSAGQPLATLHASNRNRLSHAAHLISSAIIVAKQ